MRGRAFGNGPSSASASKRANENRFADALIALAKIKVPRIESVPEGTPGIRIDVLAQVGIAAA
jgi:hypothetical protein